MRGKELRSFMKRMTAMEKEAVEALMEKSDEFDVWDVKEIEGGALVSALGIQLQLYKDGRFYGLNPNYDKHLKYFKEKPKYLDQMRPKDWKERIREANEIKIK